MNAPIPYHGAELIPFSDLERMANAIAKSGLFGMKEQTQALALMLTAQAEGQHPATITQDYDIIQGKAARKTHSVLARFQQAGGKVEWLELTEQKAKATFSHPSGGALTIEWTIAMAERARLTGKDNWKNYPRAMLRARCIAEGIRAVFPAAIGGMMLSEEAQDLDALPGEVTSKTVQVEQPQARIASEAPAASEPGQTSTGPDKGGAAPDSKTGPLDATPMKPSQVSIIRAKLKNAALTDTDLEVAFPGKSLDPKDGKDLFAFGQFADITSWIEKSAKG